MLRQAEDSQTSKTDVCATPAANKSWETKFPGIFSVTDGQMRTGELTGPGLGAV